MTYKKTGNETRNVNKKYKLKKFFYKKEKGFTTSALFSHKN